MSIYNMQSATIYLDGKPIGAASDIRIDSSGGEVGSLLDIQEALKPIEPVTMTFESTMPIGIRTWRLLSTGRPRPKREVTKRRNKQRRAIRRGLVLSASDGAWAVEQDGFGTMKDLWQATRVGRVSVPRSLRPFLGRWVGGSNG